MENFPLTDSENQKIPFSDDFHVNVNHVWAIGGFDQFLCRGERKCWKFEQFQDMELSKCRNLNT